MVQTKNFQGSYRIIIIVVGLSTTPKQFTVLSVPHYVITKETNIANKENGEEGLTFSD